MIRPFSGLLVSGRTLIGLLGNRLERVRVHRCSSRRILRTSPSLLTRLSVSFCAIKTVFLFEIQGGYSKLEGV